MTESQVAKIIQIVEKELGISVSWTLIHKVAKAILDFPREP